MVGAEIAPRTYFGLENSRVRLEIQPEVYQIEILLRTLI